VFPVGRVVYITDPKIIRNVIKGDSKVFKAGAAYTVIDFIVGRKSLLLLDGPEHVRSRRLLLPPFHGRSVERYTSVIREVVAGQISRWPSRGPFKLYEEMLQITLEIMIRAVFGITDAAQLDDLRELIPALLHINPAILLFPVLRHSLGPRSPWGRYVATCERIDKIIYTEIRRRRGSPASGQGSDILSLMLRARDEAGREMPEVEIRDQLITLLAVGHETTATSLAWVFERLLKNPQALSRLTRQMASGDEYLEAVIHETLRCRPVVMDIARTLAVPVDIGGYRLPAGTMVVPSLALLHSTPVLYRDPHAFRPERFIEEPPPPDTFSRSAAGGIAAWAPVSRWSR